ncbi:MAG: NUDIX hydrolase [SAR202 cluster bacterium]|nr:NUDIX hydrolase [SAR202 cluster bacterium]
MRIHSKVEHPVSAGGVVYRLHGGTTQVLLGTRNKPRTWNLPKGTPNPGESLEETASREVTEETGLQVELRESLGSIRYSFMSISGCTRYDKSVHFYLMEPTGGDLSLHDHEFDAVGWYPLEEALRLLTHRNEASILEKAVSHMRKP